MAFSLDLLKAELSRDEARRNKPYVDTVGKVTIGVGHNLTDKGLSDHMIDELLEDDIAEASNSLDHALPGWSELDDVRQRALLNMMFNIGQTRFQGFAHMIAAINNRDWKTASEEMLSSKWAEQVGERATRLAYMIKDGTV